MSYPHADPRRFEGLLSHIEYYLGPVTHGEGPDVAGGNRGFSIGFHAHPEYQMISAVTTGVRFQQVSAELPQEFVLSALPDHEKEAAYLVHVVAERVVQSGQGHEYGGGYVNAEPLVPGTNIEVLLAFQHPFADEGFDLYYDRGEPALRFVTLIPATRPEFDWLRDHDDDAEALLDLWESRETDLLDVHRPSAV
jgi:hypothetical protein